MVFDLKWPRFLSGSKGHAQHPASAATMVDEPRPANIEKIRFSLDLLNQYSVTRQLQVFGGILLLLMSILAGVVYHDNRESTYGSVYIATAGEMRMLSQRIAKSASMATQGDAESLKQLAESYFRFSDNLKLLRNGGELAGTIVPPSPEEVQPELQALAKIWDATEKDTVQMMKMGHYLVNLKEFVFTITDQNAHLLDVAEQVAALKLQTGASAREIAASNQLAMLTQRIAKNASSLLSGESISPEVALKLGKDSSAFIGLLNALIDGSDSLRIPAAADPEIRKKLGELEIAYQDSHYAINAILDSMTSLITAKQAGARISHGGELLGATDNMAQAYQRGISERVTYGVTLVILIALVLAALGMMAKVYLNDTRRQAKAAELSRQTSEQINRQNQDAILRLMNELGDLADGDLTVTATVSEDVTGAIADSINYTIEELRVLVGRINNAASRVTLATGIAQQTSAELLEAAKRQSLEIQAAGHSVLGMAKSMTQVSGDANQSAQVARQSLAGAGKGTRAVQDSIKGMNEIRGQIQETSKRIKRLGESSQEIGEIVELISDITEQTNVLALNAAIQAASAGDAGRGFTVVAEEVQRLAERSGEATKQIAAIVRTIQTDTQGAVSAMEESTRGVVEGAKLSDAAGQALAEIGEVSQTLAELIANISDATRRQADSATSVAGKMQDILHVTEQATAGTQRTATAVGELAGLATELKSSVAGFKVG
jgi:twitching motility protein PilJ